MTGSPGAVDRRDPGALTLDFCGEVIVLEPGTEFEFGRDADLTIDGENRHLHRRLGRFLSQGGSWWIANIGSSLLLELFDADSQSSARISSGSAHPIAYRNSIVRFSAGPTAYEIELTTTVDPSVTVQTSSDTMNVTSLKLTDDQRRLIVALAEQRLLEPQAPFRPPTSRQAAQRLDWTYTRFNRKLDNVCKRLASVGVPGLHDGGGGLAKDRKMNLVEFAVTTGLVSTDDLALLPE